VQIAQISIVQRGCGFRRQNGLYVCVDSSPLGYPIEYFIQDPAIPWKGAKVLRAPMLIEDRHGINHLALGIGAKYYPYPADFLEECRVLGVSKQIPRNFPFGKLTYGKSKLILIHPRAIPLFEYKTRHFCLAKRKERAKPGQPSRLVSRDEIEHELVESRGLKHECLGATYSLGLLDSVKKVHEVEPMTEGWAKVRTPSCRYEHPLPYEPEELGKWKHGVIAIFPRFKFTFVNKRGKYPKELRKKIEDLGFEFGVEPE